MSDSTPIPSSVQSAVTVRPAGELAGVRAVALDLDGVIYRGERILPGARETASWLAERGYQTHFLTNNSTRSRSEYAELLQRKGIPCQPRQTISSGYATARFLAAN